MLIGIYELNNRVENCIYNKKYGGYHAWYEDTFSPKTKIIGTLDFKIKGKNYNERKNNAIELAKDYQCDFGQYNWSYSELATIYNFFENVGKRYGLLKEFKENGII